MYSRGALFVAATLLVAVVVFGQVPGNIRLSAVLQNAAHAPAFAVLALIMLRLLQGQHGRYVKAFVACVAVGIGVELVQAAIGSDAEVEDVLADSIGALGALTGAAFFGRGPRLKVVLLLMVTCVVVSIAPVIWAGAAYLHRNAQFPVLAAFNSPLDLYFFKQQKPPLRIQPEGYLQVELPEGEWPGIDLQEPAPDWSSYRQLVLRFENPDDRPLSLTLRVHDRQHNQNSDDRYNVDFVLPPRVPYRLEIPLEEIRTAPHGRSMDLAQVAGLIIFGAPDSAGRIFRLNEIRLE